MFSSTYWSNRHWITTKLTPTYFHTATVIYYTIAKLTKIMYVCFTQRFTTCSSELANTTVATFHSCLSVRSSLTAAAAAAAGNINEKHTTSFKPDDILQETPTHTLEKRFSWIGWSICYIDQQQNKRKGQLLLYDIVVRFCFKMASCAITRLEEVVFLANESKIALSSPIAVATGCRFFFYFCWCIANNFWEERCSC